MVMNVTQLEDNAKTDLESAVLRLADEVPAIEKRSLLNPCTQNIRVNWT